MAVSTVETATQITRHRFTVTEYYRLADIGVLHEDSNVELIKGMILDMHWVISPERDEAVAAQSAESWIQQALHRFTVTEYDRMIEAGVFGEDDRIELIMGEVIEMSPVGIRHIACVKRLNALLTSRFGPAAVVSVQDPIHLGGKSEPLPDVALLKPKTDFYEKSMPIAEDVLLLIEVSDSSLKYDQRTKLPLYAEAMIPEVWIVNLGNDTLEIYSQPSDGKYGAARTLKRGESFTSDSLPGVTLSVEGDILV
ncbi:MAG: Uma2 family endonuclease [Chloroflexia bacterium]